MTSERTTRTLRVRLKAPDEDNLAVVRDCIEREFSAPLMRSRATDSDAVRFALDRLARRARTEGLAGRGE